MKSQPEVRIRRIAVFTGYGEDAHAAAFTSPVRRPAARPAAAVPVPDAERPLAAASSVQPALAAAVLALAAVPERAALCRAA
jgi:hypothetical protein